MNKLTVSLTLLGTTALLAATGGGSATREPEPVSAGLKRTIAAGVSGAGARIAFSSTRGRGYEVFVMNADGSGQRNLTRHPANDVKPSWSLTGGGLRSSATAPAISRST